MGGIGRRYRRRHTRYERRIGLDGYIEGRIISEILFGVLTLVNKAGDYSAMIMSTRAAFDLTRENRRSEQGRETARDMAGLHPASRGCAMELAFLFGHPLDAVPPKKFDMAAPLAFIEIDNDGHGGHRSLKHVDLPARQDHFFPRLPRITREGSVAKIVKLEHAWRRLDGRNDDG